ncbi:MAG: GTPase HflX [Eubacteriales bacterium]|nr:GTPase HflX [Eubacteriales bacterium]
MKTVYGNIESLNKTTIKELEEIYEYKIPKNQVGSTELFTVLMEISKKINKELAVYINRNGTIKLVSAGTKYNAPLPFLTERRTENSLAKLGCIHTHPGESSLLSPDDYSLLTNFKLDFVCAIAEEDNTLKASLAIIEDPENTLSDFIDFKEIDETELLNIKYLDIIAEIEKKTKKIITPEEHDQKEKVVLYIPYSNISPEDLEEQIQEFKKLATSAGLEILEIFTQNIKSSRNIIGKGKIEELFSYINQNNADCLLVDASVSPSLEKILAESLNVKIIDRTNLILDIFAQRAKSNEGKLQVELAQLKYLLPRIMGQGLALSRLGGGVGTRGPGETKLETDRRHIRRRIEILENQLQSVKQRRDIQKQNRIKKELPLVSLVGYTNSGKSTLLNTLSNDNIYAEDLLFATLDTTTRAITFEESGNKVLLTDTVGFISNIPHQLISAFKSTLEEVVEADLLLHVVDISNPNWQNQINVVNKVLEELKALDKKMIYVFNKIDAADRDNLHLSPDREFYIVSAKTGEGLNELLEGIEKLSFNTTVLKILIPYQDSKALALAHQNGEVLEPEHLETGTLLLLKVDLKKVSMFSKYVQ